MTRVRKSLQIRTRKVLGWSAAATAALVLTALPAGAAGPGHYTVSATGGATFSLFTANNLVSGSADDVLYYLSTTSPGALHLPFKIHFYAGVFSKIAVSTNGNIQMNIASPGGTTEYHNDCLASTTFPTPTALVFWDDLFFDSTDLSHGFMEGIFTKTKGSAPHRTFTISWQGHEFASSGTLVQAQVIFKEGSPTVTYIYGLNGGDSATVGVQAKLQQSATQWTCNSGSTTSVTSGMRLTFLHSS